MPRILGRNLFVLARDRNISGLSNAVTNTITSDAPDATGFGQDNRQRLSNGIRDSEFSINGFQDNSASQIDGLYEELLAASAYYGMYYEGHVNASSTEAGREFIGILTEYVIDEAVEGAALINATVSACSPIHLMNSLGISTVSGISSGSYSETPVNVSSSTSDVLGVFRCFGLNRTNGDEEISACIQDSTNGIVWATIYEFTSASGRTYEVQTGASMDVYRRLKYNFEGTGPFTASFMASAGSVVR